MWKDQWVLVLLSYSDHQHPKLPDLSPSHIALLCAGIRGCCPGESELLCVELWARLLGECIGTERHPGEDAVPVSSPFHCILLYAITSDSFRRWPESCWMNEWCLRSLQIRVSSSSPGEFYSDEGDKNQGTGPTRPSLDNNIVKTGVGTVLGKRPLCEYSIIQYNTIEAFSVSYHWLVMLARSCIVLVSWHR